MIPKTISGIQNRIDSYMRALEIVGQPYEYYKALRTTTREFRWILMQIEGGFYGGLGIYH